jgi:molecular chaperone GrpE
MTKRNRQQDYSYQEDTVDDDEIEIIEIVGLDEDRDDAPALPEEEVPDVVLDFDEPDGTDASGDVSQAVAVEREHFLRLQADFENFKRRVERERRETERRASSVVMERLLPILDNFERAISSPPDEGGNGAFRDGVVLIFRQLLEELRREGLTPIDTIGQPFDPQIHEAVATDHESGLPSHTVVEELRRGYLLRGRVLRPALVKVALDPPGSEEQPVAEHPELRAPTGDEDVDDPTIGFLDAARGFGEAGEE